MIEALIPKNPRFRLFERQCRKLYEENQAKIHVPNTFDFICHNTFFYMFVSDNGLIGAIYYFIDEDGKLFLNGFANRKMHSLNLECLRMSLDWFKCDIYAEAQNKASALCLRKCGFEKVDEQVYRFIKERKNNGAN